MKTILVPTDFSPEAKIAVQVASGIAKQFNATVVLLHVVDGVDEGSFNVEGEATNSSSWENRLFNMKLIQKAKRDLAKMESDLENAGVRFKTLLRMGDAYHGMNAAIIDQKVDLVVMGTKGSSGLAEELVGSNTEKVVRRSGCPVIAVTRRPSPTFGDIVWATSLRQEDVVMPSILKELIENYNSTVHLVRINTPGLFLTDKLMKEKLQAFADQLKLKKYTLNVYNDYTEEEGIIRFADSIGADMIALSTHGRTGLAHLLNGSIAEDVVNHAKRPGLTYVIGAKKKR